MRSVAKDGTTVPTAHDEGHRLPPLDDGRTEVEVTWSLHVWRSRDAVGGARSWAVMMDAVCWRAEKGRLEGGVGPDISTGGPAHTA